MALAERGVGVKDSLQDNRDKTEGEGVIKEGRLDLISGGVIGPNVFVLSMFVGLAMNLGEIEEVLGGAAGVGLAIGGIVAGREEALNRVKRRVKDFSLRRQKQGLQIVVMENKVHKSKFDEVVRPVGQIDVDWI